MSNGFTEIPKAKADEHIAPSWMAVQDREGNSLKPLIRCACGKAIGLKLHHVHTDGTVTASFFHAKAEQLQRDEQGFFFTHNGKQYRTEPGCGWHVFLKLSGYDGGEFPGEE